MNRSGVGLIKKPKIVTLKFVNCVVHDGVFNKYIWLKYSEDVLPKDQKLKIYSSSFIAYRSCKNLSTAAHSTCFSPKMVICCACSCKIRVAVFFSEFVTYSLDSLHVIRSHMSRVTQITSTLLSMTLDSLNPPNYVSLYSYYFWQETRIFKSGMTSTGMIFIPNSTNSNLF